MEGDQKLWREKVDHQTLNPLKVEIEERDHLISMIGSSHTNR